MLGRRFLLIRVFANSRLISTFFISLDRAIFWPCSHKRLRSLPEQLSLEVTNMPGTAKVLSSNLTRTCFFFRTGNILYQIKLSDNYLSAYLLSA